MQNTAAGFRQREGGEEEQAIGQHREDRDGIAERCRVRKRADQKWKQSPDAAAEIIAEALARSAQPCRIKLGQECAYTREIGRSEKAEREAQYPQDLIGQR